MVVHRITDDTIFVVVLRLQDYYYFNLCIININ